MVKIHKPKCENYVITTIRTSSESHFHWYDRFHINPIRFRIIADFEADNKIGNSSIGNKTSNIYEQNPVLKGYNTKSELEDVLKSDFCEFLLGYNNAD